MRSRCNTPEIILAEVVAAANGCRTHGRLKPRKDGYITVSIKGRTVRLHRLAYQIEREPIAPRLVLDHKCRNRACCNPDHLEPVTNRVNTLRGLAPTAVNGSKVQCKHGHPLDGANCKMRSGGGRRCRQCNAAEARRYRARRKKAKGF